MTSLDAPHYAPGSEDYEHWKMVQEQLDDAAALARIAQIVRLATEELKSSNDKAEAGT